MPKHSDTGLLVLIWLIVSYWMKKSVNKLCSLLFNQTAEEFFNLNLGENVICNFMVRSRIVIIAADYLRDEFTNIILLSIESLQKRIYLLVYFLLSALFRYLSQCWKWIPFFHFRNVFMWLFLLILVRVLLKLLLFWFLFKLIIWLLCDFRSQCPLVAKTTITCFVCFFPH